MNPIRLGPNKSKINAGFDGMFQNKNNLKDILYSHAKAKQKYIVIIFFHIHITLQVTL